MKPDPRNQGWINSSGEYSSQSTEYSKVTADNKTDPIGLEQVYGRERDPKDADHAPDSCELFSHDLFTIQGSRQQDIQSLPRSLGTDQSCGLNHQHQRCSDPQDPRRGNDREMSIHIDIERKQHSKHQRNFQQKQQSNQVSRGTQRSFVRFTPSDRLIQRQCSTVAQDDDSTRHSILIQLMKDSVK